ncbi:hypothetical protein B1B04_07450 [Lysinibacillus sp. KCTC 33748]|nr:hypothetical protein B1B04_07450 [Lysinibacillus sp. KCTC 33748]
MNFVPAGRPQKALLCAEAKRQRQSAQPERKSSPVTKVGNLYIKLENNSKFLLTKVLVFIYTYFTDNGLKFRKYGHIETKMTYNKKPKNKGV